MGRRREEIGRNCPYCGAIVAHGEYFCRSCHRKFGDSGDLDAPSPDRPATYVVAVPRPALSLLLSLVTAGAGQLYHGDTLKGIGFFLCLTAVSFGIVAVPYRTLLFYGIWVVSIAEALWSSRRINQYRRPFRGTSPLLYGLLGLLAVIVFLQLVTGEPGTAYLGNLLPLVRLLAG